MKYSFITQHKNTYPIRLMCQVIGVSRNGYYNYRRNGGSEIPPEDQEMMDCICRLDESSKNSYGSRRMKRALNALGYTCSRQKARRLMKKAGVWVRNRKKYKLTTNSNHKQPVFDNLVSGQFDMENLIVPASFSRCLNILFVILKSDSTAHLNFLDKESRSINTAGIWI